MKTASEVKNSNHTRTLAHETRKNKQKLAMFVMTVNSQGKVMEADTISIISGRSSKSHKSRRNWKLLTLFILLTSSFVFSSCSSSSPESDGVKAAKKFCDCINDYHGNTKKAYESYIKQFKSYSFKTRSEAREKLQESLQKVQEDAERCQENAYTYREELRNKYITNKENADKFQYAFDAHGNAFSPNYFDNSENLNNIEGLILAIIPPKPDLARIKNDFIGNEIRASYHSYGRNRWGNAENTYSWAFKANSLDELKDLEILNVTDNGDIYDVHLRLKGEANQFDMNVTYVLYDDWTIKERKMNILPTGKYDKCIEIQKNAQWGAFGIKFINLCDVDLVVVGSSGGGEFFSIKVAANSTQGYGSWEQTGSVYTTVRFNLWTIQDYSILYIERTGL